MNNDNNNIHLIHISVSLNRKEHASCLLLLYLSKNRTGKQRDETILITNQNYSNSGTKFMLIRPQFTYMHFSLIIHSPYKVATQIEILMAIAINRSERVVKNILRMTSE